MEIRHYINLANGLEFLNECESPHFIRIQSTWCEQKRWADILDDLDYGFLLDLALGHDCIVYDCGAHKETSRAMWQGIPWIRYTLNRRWFNEEHITYVRGHNASGYFAQCYHDLPTRTSKRLDYVWKFGDADRLRLVTATHITGHDGDYAHWKDVLCSADHGTPTRRRLFERRETWKDYEQ